MKIGDSVLKNSKSSESKDDLLPIEKFVMKRIKENKNKLVLTKEMLKKEKRRDISVLTKILSRLQKRGYIISTSNDNRVEIQLTSSGVRDTVR